MGLLKKFHSDHIRMNRMKLVITSPEPFESIQNYLVSSFGPVMASSDSVIPPLPLSSRVSSPPLPIEYPLPFPQESLRKITFLSPVRKSHRLYLTFQCKSVVKDYKSKSSQYLAHLIGHEGPNSLLTSLKSRGLVSSLSAGVADDSFSSNSMYSLFGISSTLTDQGMANWISVADIIFKYVRLLEARGPQEWIFEELKQMGRIDFDFLEEEEERYIASNLIS